jgi:rhodanese-related sulfurtransferase/DNA-binding winged helix-turn-helix (wHTH) protein
MQEVPDRDARSSTTIETVLRAAQSRLDRLTPQEAAREQRDEGALIVDIRSEPNRRAEGEIPGSLILERNVLEWRLDPTSSWRVPEAVDHALRAIIVCPEGYVSSFAAAGLKDVGLHRATDIVGGFGAWRDAGCPVVRSVTMAGSYVATAPDTISLDPARQQLLVDGVPVALTRLEFRLMDELLRAGGRAVTREELRSSIGDWPGSRSRSVDLHIHRIRRKLGPGAATLLASERGVGFRLRTRTADEPRPAAPATPTETPQGTSPTPVPAQAAGSGESALVHEDHVEGARPVHALDPIEFDVAGGGGS